MIINYNPNGHINSLQCTGLFFIDPDDLTIDNLYSMLCDYKTKHNHNPQTYTFSTLHPVIYADNSIVITHNTDGRNIHTFLVYFDYYYQRKRKPSILYTILTQCNQFLALKDF